LNPCKPGDKVTNQRPVTLDLQLTLKFKSQKNTKQNSPALCTVACREMCLPT